MRRFLCTVGLLAMAVGVGAAVPGAGTGETAATGAATRKVESAEALKTFLTQTVEKSGASGVSVEQHEAQYWLKFTATTARMAQVLLDLETTVWAVRAETIKMVAEVSGQDKLAVEIHLSINVAKNRNWFFFLSCLADITKKFPTQGGAIWATGLADEQGTWELTGQCVNEKFAQDLGQSMTADERFEKVAVKVTELKTVVAPYGFTVNFVYKGPTLPGAAGAPATTAATVDAADPEFTLKKAQTIVREAALSSPNPYVRETVYHDRDADWSIDLAGLKFSVKVRGPQEKTCTGRLTPTGDGWAKASFDDGAAWSRDWIVPADAALTVDEASRCLSEMCGRMSGEFVLKALGAAMKGVELKEDAATGEWIGTANRHIEHFTWHVNLKERTFTVDEGEADVGHNCSGRFGWDKDHKWMAWPIMGGIMFSNGGIRLTEYLVIPDAVVGGQ